MWAIIVLAGLAILVFLILCVPLDMALHADIHGKPKFRLRFSWLFGLVSKEIAGEKEKPEKKKGVVKVKRKHRWRDARAIFAILRTKGLLRQLKGLIIEVVFSHLKARDLVADFRVGLGDPADTGFLFAFIGPATALFGSSHRHQIKVEPSFSDDAVMEGYSHGKVRLHPIQLVPPFLKFIFSLTTIKIAKTLISSKWRGN